MSAQGFTLSGNAVTALLGRMQRPRPVTSPREDADTELLKVLEAAIIANNTDVIDNIIGVKRVVERVLEEMEGPEGWDERNDTLVKKFTFADRRVLSAFIADLKIKENVVNHHSDIITKGDSVVVTYTTHSAGDTITDEDYECVELADAIAENYGIRTALGNGNNQYTSGNYDAAMAKDETRLKRILGPKAWRKHLDIDTVQALPIEDVETLLHIYKNVALRHVNFAKRTSAAATVEFLKWSLEKRQPRAAGGPGSGNHGHAGRPGEQGGSAPSLGSDSEHRSEMIGEKSLFTSGDSAIREGDHTRFRALKVKWAKLNNELLSHIDDPTSAPAEAKMAELKEIVKDMYRLDADTGGIEGIGLPGGPRDVLIVGAGPGGLAAAVMGGTDGLDTLFIDASPQVGGQAKFSSRIENYPGFPIGTTGEDLAGRLHSQALRVGAEGMTGVRVEGIEYDPHTELKTVRLSDGRKIEARAVIVATGIEPTKLTFPGSDHDSLVYMDSQRIRREGANKAVVIIGGSNGAAQAALGAAQTAREVVVMARSPIEKSMSDYQVQALRANSKIRVIEGDSIKELVQGEDGMKLITQNGQRLNADRTGMFLGGNPKLDWLPKDVKLTGGKVAVDGNLETNIPGIFAIGDARHGSIGRIGTAVGDGQVAVRGAFDYFYRNRDKKKES